MRILQRLVFPLLIGAAVWVTTPAWGQASRKPAAILIVTGSSDEPYHHWRETTESIRSALGRSGRFEIRTSEEPRGLTAAALEGYDAVVLNYNGPRWPAPAEAALEAFIRSGKGLVAFHLDSYGTFFGMQFHDRKWRSGAAGEGWEAFPQMVGANWAPEKIGHARRSVFEVDWTNTAHPISRGLPSSFMANDELYHKLTLAPGVHVLADALSPAAIGGTGKREPMIWVNEYGKGRVFFTTLGHDSEAWYQAGLVNAFVRGVEWAATGDVTMAPMDLLHRAAEPDAARVLAVTGGHSYPTSFYTMLDSLPGIVWTHAATIEEAFSQPLENRYDAIVFHDMRDTTSENTRSRLKAFVEAGKGIVSLHHAVVDYTDWPYWYEEVTGGKFFIKATETRPASRYHENVEFLVTPAAGKESHPILRGVGPLWVYDEAYRGMWFSPKIEVLMETQYSENDRPVVYIGPHPKARVIYIQLGHSDHTMREPAYQRLVHNAVLWAARRTN